MWVGGSKCVDGEEKVGGWEQVGRWEKVGVFGYFHHHPPTYHQCEKGVCLRWELLERWVIYPENIIRHTSVNK